MKRRKRQTTRAKRFSSAKEMDNWLILPKNSFVQVVDVTGISGYLVLTYKIPIKNKNTKKDKDSISNKLPNKPLTELADLAKINAARKMRVKEQQLRIRHKSIIGF